MSRPNMPLLKLVALLFMLPGMCGLVVSTMVSANYLETMPKVPTEQQTIPRNVHGSIVYQTQAQDYRLSAMEYSSVSIFLIGLILGVIYLEKWTALRTQEPSLETDLLEGV